MAVKARPGETIDSLIRRFKKDVTKSEVIKELRRREYYMSPSEKRRVKSALAQKRIRRKENKNMF